VSLVDGGVSRQPFLDRIGRLSHPSTDALETSGFSVGQRREKLETTRRLRDGLLDLCSFF